MRTPRTIVLLIAVAIVAVVVVVAIIDPWVTTSSRALAVERAALVTSVDNYAREQGLNPSTFTVGVQLSTVNPDWARFTEVATPANVETFQNIYGFAQQQNDGWHVIAFGSAQVGCPGGPPSTVVPSDVLAEFGEYC